MNTPTRQVRCGIYTRKSSEEGLEQAFNSLHAQREACEAYVLSQKHEGWQVIPTAYDDGGFSGGNMERPGLKQLLADIAAARIDTVVVYKVDRLTRSLPDFARIVESFDNKGVSFVSVTQQFNTTSSMGRLTLNVLLSFAQFEREVTGERIRDRVAASKKKGMWMGGNIPLGYDLKDRSLVVNEQEAATVRDIFASYLRLKSVFDLQEELTRRGILSKKRVCSTGRSVGGKNFSRGTLYHLLSSPLYIGKVSHRGQLYDGLHEPIIDAKTWNATVETLKVNSVKRIASRNLASGRPLLGRLFHADGSSFVPTHASKKGRRYPYYVSRRTSGSDVRKIHRLPAIETETAVATAIREFLTQPLALAAQFSLLKVQHLRLLVTAARHRAQILSDPVSKEANQLLRSVVRSITVADSRLSIELDSAALLQELAPGAGTPQEGPQGPIALTCAFQIKRRGSEVRLVLANNHSDLNALPTLGRAVARARDWADRISSGEIYTQEQLVKHSGCSKHYIHRVLRCAALSPHMADSILAGRHPAHLTLAMLADTLHNDWADQNLGLSQYRASLTDASA